MGKKKNSIVDKLVSNKKKKRELCLDLNTNSGMIVEKDTDSIVDNVLKINKPKKKLVKIKPMLNFKANELFNVDSLQFGNGDTTDNDTISDVNIINNVKLKKRNKVSEGSSNKKNIVKLDYSKPNQDNIKKTKSKKNTPLPIYNPSLFPTPRPTSDNNVTNNISDKLQNNIQVPVYNPSLFPVSNSIPGDDNGVNIKNKFIENNNHSPVYNPSLFPEKTKQMVLRNNNKKINGNNGGNSVNNMTQNNNVPTVDNVVSMDINAGANDKQDITVSKNIVKNKIKKEKKVAKSVFSNKSVVNISKEKYRLLKEKRAKLQDYIRHKNIQISKLREHENELGYLDKVEEEKKKLVELEKTLKKIEIIKFLHQKKLSIEKYKKNYEQFRNYIEKKNAILHEFSKKDLNNILGTNYLLSLGGDNKQYSSDININNNINKDNAIDNVIDNVIDNGDINKYSAKINLNVKYPKKLRFKKGKSLEYNIDKILELINERDNIYNKIIKKYKNNLLCLKINEYDNNKYLFNNKFLINSINKLIELSKLNEKEWHSLYNAKNFIFKINTK